jgi:hypothetical protein
MLDKIGIAIAVAPKSFVAPAQALEQSQDRSGTERRLSATVPPEFHLLVPSPTPLASAYQFRDIEGSSGG